MWNIPIFYFVSEYVAWFWCDMTLDADVTECATCGVTSQYCKSKQSVKTERIKKDGYHFHD